MNEPYPSKCKGHVTVSEREACPTCTPKCATDIPTLVRKLRDRAIESKKAGWDGDATLDNEAADALDRLDIMYRCLQLELARLMGKPLVQVAISREHSRDQ